MDRFDCNIIVMFVLGVLNRDDHMDRFDCNIIELWQMKLKLITDNLK